MARCLPRRVFHSDRTVKGRIRSPCRRSEITTNIHGRIRLEAVGCIRHPPLGDEIVLVVDLAPGGLRFCSANNYSEGSHVEVAAPYSSKAPNIFAPARIVSYRKCPENAHTEYGMTYIV